MSIEIGDTSYLRVQASAIWPAANPPVRGAYWLGDSFAIQLTRRPHWVARLLCRWLLDWRWRDA